MFCNVKTSHSGRNYDSVVKQSWKFEHPRPLSLTCVLPFNTRGDLLSATAGTNLPINHGRTHCTESH